jgi:hypothetical protein
VHRGNPTSWRLTVGHPTSGRDFFSTHFDINYLPENQARTEALSETSENGGRAALTAEEGSRLWHGFAGQGECIFKRGAGQTRTLLCRGVEGHDFVSEKYGDFSPTTDKIAQFLSGPTNRDQR